MSSEGFWDDQERAQELSRRRARVENRISRSEELSRNFGDLGVLLEFEEAGEPVGPELEAMLTKLDQSITEVEMKMKLSGPHDDRDAIISIHPGAGGTESQDWADMLLRLYVRYCEKTGFETETLDYQVGEEAGIKSVTFMVRGEYAYGYLKSEHGVHRLVRISPFDANKRRQTSFAAVHVYPDIEEDIEIDIAEKDLRVDTFRASGAGGQHINVTDSAIRITHLPTGTVVSCQNERSQHKNRATAMKLLRAKLYQLEVDKRKEEQQQIEGEKKEIGFGSQIRSYVLQPYQMVKDMRTGHEVGDVQRVLDGDIQDFIEAYLLSSAQATAAAE